MPDPTTQKEANRDFAALISNWTKAIRDALLVVLLLLLLLLPSCVNDVLSSAGFTKADIAGFHWEKELEEAQEQTVAAQQQVEEVGASLKEMQTALTEISAEATNPAVKTKMEELTATVDSSQARITTAEEELKTSLMKQDRILLDANIQMPVRELELRRKERGE